MHKEREIRTSLLVELSGRILAAIGMQEGWGGLQHFMRKGARGTLKRGLPRSKSTASRTQIRRAEKGKDGV